MRFSGEKLKIAFFEILALKLELKKNYFHEIE